MTEHAATHRKASESSESNLSEPYRYGCPNGHVFERVYEDEGAYCYPCDCVYGPDELVDRADAERWTPNWARED